MQSDLVFTSSNQAKPSILSEMKQNYSILRFIRAYSLSNLNLTPQVIDMKADMIL
jgi:subtilase family serine protease